MRDSVGTRRTTLRRLRHLAVLTDFVPPKWHDLTRHTARQRQVLGDTSEHKVELSNLGVTEVVDVSPQQISNSFIELDEHVDAGLANTPVIVFVRLQATYTRHHDITTSCTVRSMT